jgi:hypothetical protein
MSCGVKFKAIYVPEDIRGFLDQASRPFHEILGAEDEKGVCEYIQILGREHAPMGALFKAALDHDKKEKASWKPLIRTTLFSMAQGAAITTVIGILYNIYARSRPDLKIPMSLVKFICNSAIFGAVLGGLYALYNRTDAVSYDLRLRAKNEQGWMQTRLTKITEKLKTAYAELDQVNKVTDTEKPEYAARVITMTQLQILETYFKDISSRRY